MVVVVVVVVATFTDIMLKFLVKGNLSSWFFLFPALPFQRILSLFIREDCWTHRPRREMHQSWWLSKLPLYWATCERAIKKSILKSLFQVV